MTFYFEEHDVEKKTFYYEGLNGEVFEKLPLKEYRLDGIAITATGLKPKLKIVLHIKNLQLADKLDKIDTSTVGGRVQYFRMLNKMSLTELARLTGVKRNHLLAYEECANNCPPDFCVAVAKIFNIELSLLCDEYTLFLNTDYIEKIESAKKKHRLSYFKLAEKYNIPHDTLIAWVRGLYAPSRHSFYKYIKENALFRVS